MKSFQHFVDLFAEQLADYYAVEWIGELDHARHPVDERLIQCVWLEQMLDPEALKTLGGVPAPAATAGGPLPDKLLRLRLLPKTRIGVAPPASLSAAALTSPLERASPVVLGLGAWSDYSVSLQWTVEEPADLASIERSGSFDGRYFVLGGALSPIDGVGPDELRIAELEERARRGDVSEVILATNPNAEGDATAHYISSRLRSAGVRLSRSFIWCLQ